MKCDALKPDSSNKMSVGVSLVHLCIHRTNDSITNVLKNRVKQRETNKKWFCCWIEDTTNRTSRCFILVVERKLENDHEA